MLQRRTANSALTAPHGEREFVNYYNGATARTRPKTRNSFTRQTPCHEVAFLTNEVWFGRIAKTVVTPSLEIRLRFTNDSALLTCWREWLPTLKALTVH